MNLERKCLRNMKYNFNLIGLGKNEIGSSIELPLVEGHIDGNNRKALKGSPIFL